MRKRKQFKAQILTATGRPVTECFVIADIETEVAGQTRSVRWGGKITSLSEPQHALAGAYRLRPEGTDQGSPIEVVDGVRHRLGITSDEYTFRGDGAPPEMR